MRGAALAVCVAISLGPLRAHAQDPAPPPEYDGLVDDAVEEYAAGRWAEARALFLRAHAAYPNARTLRGIGMSSYELRDYVEAVTALDRSLAETRRALTAEQRAQITALLDRARAFVGRFTLRVAPAGATLTVDGLPREIDGWPSGEGTLLLSVGTHQVGVRSPSGAVVEARVDVRGGERTSLAIDLPASTPAPDPMADTFGDDPGGGARAVPPVDGPGAAPIAVAVAGGALAVGGVVLLAMGLADISTVEDAGSGTEWADLEDPEDRAPILTGLGLGGVALGAAGLAVGVAWAVGGSGEDDDDAVAIRIGPGSIAIGGSL